MNLFPIIYLSKLMIALIFLSQISLLSEEPNSASLVNRQVLTFSSLEELQQLPPAKPPLKDAGAALRWAFHQSIIKKELEKNFHLGFRQWTATSQKEGTATTPFWAITLRSRSLIPSLTCHLLVNEQGQIIGPSQDQTPIWEFAK